MPQSCSDEMSLDGVAPSPPQGPTRQTRRARSRLRCTAACGRARLRAGDGRAVGAFSWHRAMAPKGYLGAPYSERAAGTRPVEIRAVATPRSRSAPVSVAEHVLGACHVALSCCCAAMCLYYRTPSEKSNVHAGCAVCRHVSASIPPSSCACAIETSACLAIAEADTQ